MIVNDYRVSDHRAKTDGIGESWGEVGGLTHKHKYLNKRIMNIYLFNAVILTIIALRS